MSDVQASGGNLEPSASSSRLVDRAALIEAAAAELPTFVGPGGALDWEKRETAASVLDAVLPLIADAIEDPIRHSEAVHYEFCSLAQAGALVRSLLSTDSDQ